MAGTDWETGALDVPRLLERSDFYAERAGASPALREGLQEVLTSQLGGRLVRLAAHELARDLIMDAYKPKMHRMYATYLAGVHVDFALNVRRTPIPLEQLHQQDPELYAEFEAQVAALVRASPLSPGEVDVLRLCFHFDTPQVMLERAHHDGVAPVRWDSLPEPEPSGAAAAARRVAVASGHAEAASHAETSLTQLVQQVTLRAQVRRLAREEGVRLDGTERLASALGHLAGVVQRVNAATAPHGTKVALFAGRRSSDRTFLLLQNLFCRRHITNYAGTSSVYAAAHMNHALLDMGVSSPAERAHIIGRLVGTHAHELMSVLGQLLAAYDDEAGGEGGPVSVSALLAHLLFLATNGGLAGATALADTFTTPAFLAAALACRVPDEWVTDMHQRFPNQPQPHAGMPCFDVFRIWRLDSGDYSKMADTVMSAWEQRCRQAAAVQQQPQSDGGQRAAAAAEPAPAPARPQLMHSNLSSIDELEEVMRLPERIRPAFLAFGGLADGFMPFEQCSSSGVREPCRLQMASIVMKAVQARHPGVRSSMECAAKQGDDASLSKIQVDPRLPGEAQARVRARLAAMARLRPLDSQRCGAALAAAYHAVTRDRVLS